MAKRRVVIEIPEELTNVADAMQQFSDEVSQLSRQFSGNLSAVDYAAVERQLGRLAGNIELAGHRRILESLDVKADKVRTGDGVIYANVGRHEATYYTAVGPVGVMRSIFRRTGERNAKTVDAIALRTGSLSGGWLPQTARAMGHMAQQGTSREAEAASREIGRLPYSRSSFEDVAHALGAEAVSWQPTMDPMLAAVEPTVGAWSVSVALDRVSIPMEEPKARPVGRPKKGAPKRPINRVYRMAWCGTATLHDVDGKALHTIRMGDMPDADPNKLAARLLVQVQAWLRENPGLKVVRMADGAPQLWDLLRRHFTPETLGTSAIHEHVDVWHVLEHLAVAAAAMNNEPEGVLARWRLLLFNHAEGAKLILEQLTGVDLRMLSKDAREDVRQAITYLENHKDRFTYAQARALGLPCGSGNVEATCKSLMAQRLKRSGARWKTTSGREIIELRSLALSDHWSPAMYLLFNFRRKDLKMGHAA